MNPLNELLRPFGIGIHRLRRPPPGFVSRAEKAFRALDGPACGFTLVKSIAYDGGEHPTSYKDYECGFAASRLAAARPASILDIGSYRQFVLGVSAGYSVTSLDVRQTPKISDNEMVAVGDAKAMPFPDNHFDAIVSLSSLEHFGLGRYGDEVDLAGDRRAFDDMKRCLKPGGHLIFTTTLTAGQPCLVFNLHRIYTRAQLHDYCAPLTCSEEAFYSHRLNRFCALSEISQVPGEWDVYCGSWRKP